MLSLFKNFAEKIAGKGYDNPIPQSKPMAGWKETPIDEKGASFNEPLVPVGIFSDYPDLFSDGIYYGERNTSPYKTGELDGALITSFVREGVAKRLAKASKMLPPGHAFLLLDTLRTEKVQSSLFEHFKNALMSHPFNLSEEVAIEKTQDYVSQPSRANSPHMTGGSVDLTVVKFEPDAWKELQGLTKKLRKIASDKSRWHEVYKIEMRRHQLLREKSQTLDMGVAFDEVAVDETGAPKTALRYYEEKLENGRISPEEVEPLKNRRLLYNVMNSVGFTFFPEEPWHADYGNKFWAKQSGAKTALYGYAELSPKNKAYEDMRRNHHAGNIELSTLMQAPLDRGKTSNPIMDFVHATAQMCGKLRYVRLHTSAHVISPAPNGPSL
ncbi:MAG: M15 family metallopeptidase [Alphaproteobacteria bacterium]|nr:M15 family metallopeptidase [Alphaproteobacteria bacterium]